jgi:hypothetical protein
MSCNELSNPVGVGKATLYTIRARKPAKQVIEAPILHGDHHDMVNV